LKKEKIDLEAESYAKARILSNPASARNQQILKEYGRRLKYVQKRMGEIDSEIDGLLEERVKIKEGLI